MKRRTILSLCDYTGTWSQPYVDAGYNVVRVDIKNGLDVRHLQWADTQVWGIIAQPPCTHFAGSGARWWAKKGKGAIEEGMALVDACLRAVLIYDPMWWVLENPVGRLRHYIGPFVETYNPWEFAMLADDPDSEAYTKRTCLWGSFIMPNKCPHPEGPILGSKMHKLPPSPQRAALRSATPQGFARAFFERNQ